MGPVVTGQFAACESCGERPVIDLVPATHGDEDLGRQLCRFSPAQRRGLLFRESKEMVRSSILSWQGSSEIDINADWSRAQLSWILVGHARAKSRAISRY
jgi:hypothetical protein